MTKPTKHSMLAASLALIGVTAMGCGAGGAPTDASEKEFCDNLNSLYKDLGSMEGKSDKETIAIIKDWGKSLEKVGTPKSVSDDERKGFEVTVDQIDGLDENGSTKDFDKLQDDLSATDKKNSEAFQSYTNDTCGQIGSDAQ